VVVSAFGSGCWLNWGSVLSELVVVVRDLVVVGLYSRFSWGV